MDDAKVANTDLRKIYPDIRVRLAKVLTDMKDHFKEMRVTEGYRSFERQNYLYAKGRTLKDLEIATNSVPGNSLHNYGLALDLAFKGTDPYSKSNPKIWEDYGRIVRAHGFTWGGDWNNNGIKDKNDFDKPHIQLTYGLSLEEIKKKYASGRIEAIWSTIDAIRGVPIGDRWLSEINNLGG